MKWGKPKFERFSTCYNIYARKRGYKAQVRYIEGNCFAKRPFFYFSCEKGDKTYNSMWDKKAYKTEEAAKIACEKWIDEQVGGAE